MKCTRCGNELKDGVKFCQQCGEPVKEERKAKFCKKCGNELQDGVMFCSKCGMPVGAVQELGVVKKPEKKDGKLKKIFLIAGIAIIVLLSIGCIMLNSEKAMYKAYVKFHEEYREKNAEYEQLNDCAARIIMSPGNKKWLAIHDITYVNDDETPGKNKITLYRYSWGKVKKVASFSKKIVEEFINFVLIDDELYLLADFGDWNTDVSKKDNLKCAYRLKGDKFEPVKVKEVKRKYKDLYTEDELLEMGIDLNDSYYEYFLSSGMEHRDFLFLGNMSDSDDQLIVVNDIRSADAKAFEEIIEELSQYKTRNQVELQIAYGKVLKEVGLFPGIEESYQDSLSSDYPVVGTMKTEQGYYYVRTSGNTSLAYLAEDGDFDKAVKSADGRKVTGIVGVGRSGNLPDKVKLPDNITYIGRYAFYNSGIESIELSDSLTRIGSNAFSGCWNLKEVKRPDTVEKIGRYAFEDCSGLIQVEIPDTVKDIGDDIFSLMFTTRLMEPIIIAEEGSYAHGYAEENGIEWAEKKLGRAEFKERERIREALEAYKEWIDGYEAEYENEEYNGVTLGYVNDDNIPECFVWKNYKNVGYGTGLTILSYMNGKVIVSDDFSATYSPEQITYTPRSGKVCGDSWVNGYGAVYMVYELTDKFETITEIHDFMAGFESGEEYTVNGEDYGSHGAIENYISSLGLNDYFTEDDICYDIGEAYDNLKELN